MAITIVLKRLSEGGISSKNELREGRQISCLDSEIESAAVPAICTNCGIKNLLIAEDFDVVETHEKGDGTELCHSSHAYGRCKNIKCNKDMELKIDLWEYPTGILSFEKDFIQEIENCKYEDC